MGNPFSPYRILHIHIYSVYEWSLKQTATLHALDVLTKQKLTDSDQSSALP